MGTIIGIDFGMKHIGVAVSDPGESIAFPHAILDVKTQNDAIKYIENLCKEKKCAKMVLGLPKSLRNEETTLSRKVRIFANELEKKIHCRIIFQDERFTSREARRRFQDMNIRKKRVDETSAHIILQSYLDAQKSGF